MTLLAFLERSRPDLVRGDADVAEAEMGELGAADVPDGAVILTHCNAGALATAGYGTALGVIRSAHRDGKVSMVWVDETRPVLQGARLTAWEMVKENIPATLITDNMAGFVMASGEVRCWGLNITGQLGDSTQLDSSVPVVVAGVVVVDGSNSSTSARVCTVMRGFCRIRRTLISRPQVGGHILGK